ncbi:MAG: acetyltransferase [Desulfuromonadaceae bacterium]|nr:acetyltransferase [Desulfuromonadaceae bacterium]
MEKVIIFGNSLFAELYYDCLTNDSPYEVVAFTVDREYITGDSLFGLPVIPFADIESVFPPSRYKMIVSVSFQKVNRVREEKYLQAKAKGYELINYINSKASTWSGLELGDNCSIGPNCIVEAFARIGNNVTVTNSVIIGHHVVLNDHTFVAPGAVILGGVTVGSHSLIGANATIKEGVTIAPDCIVGTGVSITRNTVEKGVYFNRSPELYPKRSDELREWLTWPVDPDKPRWGSGPRTKKQQVWVPDNNELFNAISLPQGD